MLSFSTIIFIYPGLILGDSSKPVNSSLAVGYVNDHLITGINLSRFDSSFFSILITSIVIIGILLFAMWQIFRSKRQS
jgi:hypothetical protein